MEPPAEDAHVEVYYALPGRATCRRVKIERPVSLEFVIQQSGILEIHPEIDLSTNSVGIFGRKEALDYQVRAGDRVEIYRPLLADPKQARRARAKTQKSQD